MKSLQILCFTMWCCPLLAQPKINLDEIKLAFPNAPAVVYNEEVLNLDVIADQLTATREYTIRYVVLDEKAIGLGEKAVTYIPGFFELSKFEATTYVPNGKSSYKKLKVDQWEDKNRINYMFFFDDVKYRHFVFSGVQKGAILELKYTYNQLDPTMQFPFHFQESIPLVKGSFTLHYSDKVKPYIKFFGDSISTKYSQLGDGKTTSTTWSVENYPEWKDFSHAPSHRYTLPHAFPMIKEYKTATGWQSGLNTTQELYVHNTTFIKDLNKSAPIAELKSLVDSLKSVSSTQEDLTRNIYYWVQEHIKYIAFEDGLGGFVPRQANDIFRKRYGDCKDMSSLITFMCTTAGIPAYVTWIGTRELPYRYSELPLPNSDNHMIAAIYTKNNWQFLDATARFLRYGFPSGFIQGKEALIAITPDSFQVVKVPVMAASANKRYDSSHLTLDKDLLKGDITLQLDGYHKFDLVENLKMTKSDKVDETMQHSLVRGNNKCKISSVLYQDLEDRDKQLTISAKFELPDYAKLIDNNIYINLHLDRSIASLKIDTLGRNVPREFDFELRDLRVVTLEIPQGYKVSKLPAAASFTHDKYSYVLTYSKQGTKVMYRFERQINTLMLGKKDFADWNKSIDKLNQAFKEVVVLEKI